MWHFSPRWIFRSYAIFSFCVFHPLIQFFIICTVASFLCPEESRRPKAFTENSQLAQDCKTYVKGPKNINCRRLIANTTNERKWCKGTELFRVFETFHEQLVDKQLGLTIKFDIITLEIRPKHVLNRWLEEMRYDALKITIEFVTQARWFMNFIK